MCSAENTIGQTTKQFTLIVLDYQVTTMTTTTTTELTTRINQDGNNAGKKKNFVFYKGKKKRLFLG